MAQNDFLARIKLVLEGKNETVAGLQQTQQAAQQLSKTKVTTTFDKEGLATGKQIEETFGKMGESAKKSTPLMNQLGLAMKRALLVAPVWMLMRNILLSVFNTIGDNLKFLVELETAMTRIKIVGKGTEEEYKTLQTSLVGLAHTYGTSATEAAKAAVLFAQQGRTIKETIALTAAAMLASQILGTDLKTSVDDMTAAIEGFKLGIGDATSIVDKWINVEKQFAVTSKDLADATKVAGASANQLGITINEFLGDVTAIVEVTRKSGSEAARALSFIYARLLTSGKKTIEQITKIPFYLDATGKATNTVGIQMRSVSSILEDLAGKWESLTTQERLEIATSLGSKRQMVGLYALMQNYNASLDARIASLTSAGAAEKAFALIQDTTAIKLKKISAGWNLVTSAIGDTAGFKSALSVMDNMLINLTALINYEKAYGAVYAQAINKVQLANKTRINEVKSLEELLAIKNKLSKAPKTEENIGRLKTIQDALDTILAKSPSIKIAVEAGNPKDIKKAATDTLKELEMTDIRYSVSLIYEPQIGALEKEIASIKEWTPSRGLTAEEGKNLAVKEEKVLKLYEEQAKAIEDQYKIQKGQEVAKQLSIDGIEEEAGVSAELTSQEIERLNIEKELSKIRYNGVSTVESQIKKEIELVKQSKNLYEAHDKNLKLEELSNRLLDAKLQKRQKEISSLVDLSMQYEKADMIDKSRIKRLAELQQMRPEDLASVFSRTSSMFDKGIIEEYWSSFSEEAQLAVAKTTDLFRQMSARLPQITIPAIGKTTTMNADMAQQKNITNQIIGAQIQQININLPEVDYNSLADQAGHKVAERLKTDVAYIELVAKGIRKKI